MVPSLFSKSGAKITQRTCSLSISLVVNMLKNSFGCLAVVLLKDVLLVPQLFAQEKEAPKASCWHRTMAKEEALLLAKSGGFSLPSRSHDKDGATLRIKSMKSCSGTGVCFLGHTTVVVPL